MSEEKKQTTLNIRCLKLDKVDWHRASKLTEHKKIEPWVNAVLNKAAKELLDEKQSQ